MSFLTQITWSCLPLICACVCVCELMKKLMFSFPLTIERQGVSVPMLFDNTGVCFHKNAIKIYI